MDHFLDDSIVEMFFFETEQLIEQIDHAILRAEQSHDYSSDFINEIFRSMHTIKGSASTMKVENIAELHTYWKTSFIIFANTNPSKSIIQS